jgi:acyl dehydratase
MNHHPLHIDAEYCKDHYPGKILVVGTLVFSLVVGMSVRDISGKAIANLEYESVKHEGPVFIGDTIYSATTILSKRESKSKKDRGIIYVETVAHNQFKEKVLTFRRKVLIPKKNTK